jgi:hypothetical protein
MSLRDTPKHESSRAAVPAAMAGETPALRNFRSSEKINGLSRSRHGAKKAQRETLIFRLRTLATLREAFCLPLPFLHAF